MPASTDGTGFALTWQTVYPLDQAAANGSVTQPSGSTSDPDPNNLDVPSTDTGKSARPSPWIAGIGGGARIGSGEPTYPIVYGRFGRMLGRNAALSLRPRYIFGNSDLQGQSNNEGAFQMPLTLDLIPSSWFSPYLGGGVATNTDSTGKTNGMMSMGADIRINRNLAIDLGMNYIFQSSTMDSNNRDLEFTTVLYFRF